MLCAFTFCFIDKEMGASVAFLDINGFGALALDFNFTSLYVLIREKR